MSGTATCRSCQYSAPWPRDIVVTCDECARKSTGAKTPTFPTNTFVSEREELLYLRGYEKGRYEGGVGKKKSILLLLDRKIQAIGVHTTTDNTKDTMIDTLMGIAQALRNDDDEKQECRS